MEILNKYIYDPQLDLLGKGGFATVYKAYDKVLEMPVALKFFHPQDQSNKYTIINEIKRAIILAHPNIVKYYGVETLVNRNFHGQEEEVQIGVMEFVQEGQMKTFMSQNPLTTEQLKKLLIDILEGLRYLHSEGIIHRDIKPQNILLGRDKQNRLVAKIADFGISKAADSNQASASILLGTIEYMAPEQFNPERYGINKKISYNVDVWAFGVTAYYLLTGDLLFGSRSGDTSAAQMITKIVSAEGIEERLLKLQEPFKSVLLKCIIPDANKRTSDIEELISILKGQAYQKKHDPFENSASPAPASTLNHFTQSAPAAVSDDHTMEISTPQPASKPPQPAKAKAARKPVQAAADDSTQEINPADLPKAAASTVPDEAPEEKKAGSKKWLIAAVIAVVLGGGGYWAYSNFAAGNKDEKAATEPDMVLSIGSNLVPLQGGSFAMGTNDPKRNLDGPEHTVQVNPFLLNRYEVTQREWNAVMKDNRYKDTTFADFPADSISWEDTQAFITALNKLLEEGTRKGNKYEISRFRLPTDAEWEFACVSGHPAGKEPDLANISWNMNNSGKTTHKVGTKAGDDNALFDMLGNVYEWTSDWYGPYQQASPQQGKVLRGGDYENDVFFVHEKARNAEVVNKRNKNIGFRLAADKSAN
ncbi:bifunctional serine/threonine-protein kinase/formylglycine-generating enzyme family protein [Sediminibacterium ginsengisoli]|uniref:Serine/threonine protein kinase n=1 Tax=Sediminibacterium ginsengisoli TaxID=413434 RepID=A0A1T4KNI2_9BACT|nr:bifunctional serine/threonine-protein kinase/formylglycine-generating enzyme family protein [Sediminibacterium ginsengisoli]SJZ43961.1 Serine/threonine protein kinase [Sediminibacterium ginsengisoli]